MTCREFADFMADYLSGELAPDTRAQFERHLSLCDTCVTYLKDYEATIKLGKQAYQATDAPIPQDVPDDLVEAILRATRSTRT